MNDLKNIRKGIFQVITCHHKDMIYIYIYSNFWWLKVSWWLGFIGTSSLEWFLLDVNEAELQALFEEARWSDLFWEFGCSSGKEVIFGSKTAIFSALKKMFQLIHDCLDFLWSLLVFGWSLPRFNLLIQKKGTESRISPRTFKKISAMMDNGIDFLHEQLLQLLDLSHVGVTSISCAATMLRCALADGLLRMRTWLGWPSHAFPKHQSFWMEWRQTGPDRYSLCLENRKFQVV